MVLPLLGALLLALESVLELPDAALGVLELPPAAVLGVLELLPAAVPGLVLLPPVPAAGDFCAPVSPIGVDCVLCWPAPVAGSFEVLGGVL